MTQPTQDRLMRLRSSAEIDGAAHQEGLIDDAAHPQEQEAYNSTMIDFCLIGRHFLPQHSTPTPKLRKWTGMNAPHNFDPETCDVCVGNIDAIPWDRLLWRPAAGKMNQTLRRDFDGPCRLTLGNSQGSWIFSKVEVA